MSNSYLSGGNNYPNYQNNGGGGSSGVDSITSPNNTLNITPTTGSVTADALATKLIPINKSGSFTASFNNFINYETVGNPITISLPTITGTTPYNSCFVLQDNGSLSNVNTATINIPINQAIFYNGTLYTSANPLILSTEYETLWVWYQNNTGGIITYVALSNISSSASGSINEITSSDSTLLITDPNGPITDAKINPAKVITGFGASADINTSVDPATGIATQTVNYPPAQLPSVAGTPEPGLGLIQTITPVGGNNVFNIENTNTGAYGIRTSFTMTLSQKVYNVNPTAPMIITLPTISHTTPFPTDFYIFGNIVDVNSVTLLPVDPQYIVANGATYNSAGPTRISVNLPNFIIVLTYTGWDGGNYTFMANILTAPIGGVTSINGDSTSAQLIKSLDGSAIITTTAGTTNVSINNINYTLAPAHGGGTFSPAFNNIYPIMNTGAGTDINLDIPITSSTPINSTFKTFVQTNSNLPLNIQPAANYSIDGTVTPDVLAITNTNSLITITYVGTIAGIFVFTSDYQMSNGSGITAITATQTPTTAQQNMDYALNGVLTGTEYALTLKRLSNINAKWKHWYFRSWGDAGNSGISEEQALPVAELTDPASSFYTTMVANGDIIDLPIGNITGNLTLASKNQITYRGQRNLGNIKTSFSGKLITPTGAANIVTLFGMRFLTTGSGLAGNSVLYFEDVSFLDFTDGTTSNRSIYYNCNFGTNLIISTADYAATDKTIVIVGDSYGSTPIGELNLRIPVAVESMSKLHIYVYNVKTVNVLEHAGGHLIISNASELNITSTAVQLAENSITITNCIYGTTINKTGKCKSTVDRLTGMPTYAVWMGVTTDLSNVEELAATGSPTTYTFLTNTTLRNYSLSNSGGDVTIPAFTLYLEEQPLGTELFFTLAVTPLLAWMTNITLLTISPAPTNPTAVTIRWTSKPMAANSQLRLIRGSTAWAIEVIAFSN